MESGAWGRRDFSTSAPGVSESVGEFVPTIVTSTGTITLFNTSICRWAIQGSLATFNIHILVQSVAAPTGSFNIRGFPAGLTPFTGGDATQGFMACAVFGATMTAGAGSANLMGRFFNGPPLSLTLFQLGGGTTVNIAAFCQASTNFEVMASYRIA